ncbi:MAG: efflux transporter outer membrane subunit [Casimicrobiaceae bacterium]
MRFRSKLSIAILAGLVLAGCAGAPKYDKPDVDIPAAWKELDGWKVAEPNDAWPKGNWWIVFDDPKLQDLLALIDISNQNIKQAEAQYRASQALARAAQAGLFPSVSGRAGATRLGQGSTQSSQFSLVAAASWEIDLWGRVRSSVTAADASAEASAGDLEGAKLSAKATLVQSYFQMRIAEAQKLLLDETVTGYERSLQLTTNQYNAGLVAKADVIQAETQLNSAKAQVLDAGINRQQFEHAIAILIGRAPAALSIPAGSTTMAVPRIPVGVPSALLERRPDIASAERKMAAANAQVGVARAALFPALTLSASAGLQSSTLGTLFSLPSRVWSIGPALAATLFDAGLRRAQTDQAIAQFDFNVAVYRQTVLTAFQEVEDNLVALRLLEQEAAVQDDAVRGADQSVQITLNQYRAETISYLNVVTAQNTAYANKRTALDIQRRRLVAAAALVKALGGGWDGLSAI